MEEKLINYTFSKVTQLKIHYFKFHACRNYQMFRKTYQIIASHLKTYGNIELITIRWIASMKNGIVDLEFENHPKPWDSVIKAEVKVMIFASNLSGLWRSIVYFWYSWLVFSNTQKSNNNDPLGLGWHSIWSHSVKLTSWLKNFAT